MQSVSRSRIPFNARVGLGRLGPLILPNWSSIGPSLGPLEVLLWLPSWLLQRKQHRLHVQGFMMSK